MNLETSKFRAALTPLHKLVGRRLSLPVLNCVWMEGKDGALSIRATDLEQDQAEIIPCDGDIAACCVPVGLLSKLTEIAKDKITLELTNGRLTFDSGGKAVIGILPAEEFPAIQAEKSDSIGVGLADLVECVRAVKWAQALDKTARAALCCVHVKTEPKRIFAEATTGKNYAKIEKASIATESEFTVESDFVDGFCAALERQGAVLSISEKHLIVIHANGRYSCKRSELTYPSTKNFCTWKESKIGTMPVGELLEIASISRQMAVDEMARIRVKFSKLGAECRFVSKTGNSYNRVIDGQYADLDAFLDAESLVAILSNTTRDMLEISCAGSLDPFIFNGGEITMITAQVRAA